MYKGFLSFSFPLYLIYCAFNWIKLSKVKNPKLKSIFFQVYLMSWVSTGTSTPTLLERLSVRSGPSCLRVPPTPTCWPSSPSPWRGTWPSAGLSMCFLFLILKELFWCLLYVGQQLCWLLCLIYSSQGTVGILHLYICIQDRVRPIWSYRYRYRYRYSHTDIQQTDTDTG